MVAPPYDRRGGGYSGRSRGRGNFRANSSSPIKTRSDDSNNSPKKSSDGFKKNLEESSRWDSWTSFCLEVGNLPSDTKVIDLFHWFSADGEIGQLEILGREAGSARVKAKIKFDSPPAMDFGASRKYDIKHHGARWIVPIDRFYGWDDKKHDNREYPCNICLQPHSLSFGVRLGEKRMKEMKTFQAVDSRPFHLELKTTAEKKNVTARFFVPCYTEAGIGLREFKFFVPIAQMKVIYQQNHNDGTCSLIMPLSIPPEYYWRNNTLAETMPGHVKAWRIQDCWYRATDVVANLSAPLYYPIAIYNDIKDPGFTAVGRWTTMRFVVDAYSEALKHLRLALEDSNIAVIDSPQFQYEPASKPSIWGLLDHASTPHSSAVRLLESTSQIIHLEFPVRYQLEVCISKGHLNEHLITEEFLQKLAGLDPIRGRLRLEYLVDQKLVLEDPMDLFESQEFEAYYQPHRLPYYCTLVRKAIVTPTTVRFSTPVAEISNRVIRQYSLLQDRFLRIQFLDEAEKRKTGFSHSNGAIYQRMMRTLYQGVRIGDRRYEFLAFGSSQLRECGAYFFCPTETVSCDDIRQWMGDFDHIKNVAKFAARLGQCFSTTREIRGIPAPHTREVPDIERNGYCFSDGVGIISGFLARFIIQEMALDVFDDPSAFQFRMGGSKGVLVVWPQAKGMEVHIRPSQEKFKSRFMALEVIRCSKVATATLNRQTIVILESLGVRPFAFLNLLDRHLRRFQRAVTDRSVAIELLTQFVDENQTTLVMAALLKANFLGDTTKELFVDSILRLWRVWSLKLIKEKARIHVEQSAFVLGVVDETATLRGHSEATEGSGERDPNKLPQIFLQLSDPNIYNKTTIVKGICIVGRNPSLHPGDIRVVQAVDDPNLRHLKDVVVFPGTGDRPVPNMLSGGDLDGDDFFVIWDQTLIPSEWNHPPMNYSGPEPREIQAGVTVDNLRDFFVSYQKNDVLGLVAASHLGFADSKPQGPKDETCLALAAKHSDAVDFPKTGVPVRWDGLKQRWPHFMEKKNSYTSRRSLGKLYDRVCQQSMNMEFHLDWEDDFDPRILNRYTFTDEMVETATAMKVLYDTSVRRILSQHSLGTEFELWTGFAMTKPAAGTDYKRSEDLGKEYDALKSRFRELCYDKAGGHSPEKIDPFVAAMYKATEQQVKAALRENNERTETVDKEHEGVRGSHRLDSASMPLISFPWIFPWEMIRIAMGGKYNPKKSMLAPIRRNFEQPFYKPASKGPDAGAEATHAEAKPSEALNIAAQENAEPSTADDAGGVSGPGQPYGRGQDTAHAPEGEALDMGLKDGAPKGSGVHALDDNKATGKENIETTPVKIPNQGILLATSVQTGMVGAGLKEVVESDVAQTPDNDSDEDSESTEKGEHDSMEDMIAKLASWGE